jgi:hypothetical protein
MKTSHATTHDQREGSILPHSLPRYQLLYPAAEIPSPSGPSPQHSEEMSSHTGVIRREKNESKFQLLLLALKSG